MIATLDEMEVETQEQALVEARVAHNEAVRRENARRAALLRASLNDIGLSIRTVNALENDDDTPNAYGVVRKIHTVGELLRLRPDEITAIPNLGEKTLLEIFTCLAKHGFTRKGFVVIETERDREEQALRMRQEQLHRRIGYR